MSMQHKRQIVAQRWKQQSPKSVCLCVLRRCTARRAPWLVGQHVAVGGATCTISVAAEPEYSVELRALVEWRRSLSRRSATNSCSALRSELRKISPKTITMPRSFLIKKAGSTTNYSHCPLKKRPVHIIKDSGLSIFWIFELFSKILEIIVWAAEFSLKSFLSLNT